MPGTKMFRGLARQFRFIIGCIRETDRERIKIMIGHLRICGRYQTGVDPTAGFVASAAGFFGAAFFFGVTGFLAGSLSSTTSFFGGSTAA